MLISFITPEIIKPFFPNNYYHRGMSYYEEDRVHDLDIEIKNNSEIITSCVEGEGGNHYQVSVELAGRPNKLYIRGTCTCPMAINCKHVVATVLTAIDEHKFIFDEMDDDIPYVEFAPEPPRRDPRIDTWLSNLKSIMKEEKKLIQKVDETYSLRYIFYSENYHHNRNQLHLKLQLARRLKSGALGSFKDYSLKSSSQEKHLFPIDKDLLIKLEIAKHHSSSNFSYDNHFDGPVFEKCLPELIATNRCHWLKPNEISITLGDPKTAELVWQVNEEGVQELKFLFSDGKPESYHILMIDQAWYINKDTGQIGLLKTNLDQRLLKTLLSAPKIPPEAAHEVANLLDESYKFDAVTRPKLFTTNILETATPRVRLHLFQMPITTREFDRGQWQVIQINKPLAALTFDYQGMEIPWDDSRDIFNLVNEEQVITFKRHKKMENRAFEILISHGLIQLDRLLEYNQIKSNKELLNHFLVGKNQSDCLNFSFHVLPQLREQGWEISIASDYPYQIVDESIDDWYTTIEEESSNYNWFNLELGIILGGEKVNLLPILQQVLQNLQASKNKTVEPSEPMLAQLPDGRFLPLPADRVQSILNVLIELYDSKSLSEDHLLRLSKLQAARLMELEAATGAAQHRWFGGEKLKKLAEKLTLFKQIEPVMVPKEFKGELRPYQIEGLNWLQFLREYEFSGILADDMGLGKTVQTLCHLAIEKAAGRSQKPSLIIAPTSLMFNWFSEAQRFVPHLKILVLHGSHRKSFFAEMADYDLIFTTYPLLKYDKENLLQQDFYFLILDEAQSIKNSKSLATQIVQQIRAQHRLCLTGTPLENHLGELWSLFHFMMPGLLGDEKKFNFLFRNPIEKQYNQERRQHLNRRIAPFLLRRTKNEVVKELPDKVHMIQHLELEGEQRDLYETIRVTLQKKIRDEIAKMGFARSQIVILDALLKLRQVCCDPRLLKTESLKRDNIKSAKLELLMTLLPELLEEGRRVLLFSQFTEMLGLIEAELKSQKIPYVLLTGQTKDRATPVKQFQEGQVPLFLISLKAGGTGLNLTAADTVIHYDPWWNPAVEDQATDRAHRIGQDKVVFVYKFVTKGTVEEKILEMQMNKRALIEGLFSESGSGGSHFSEQDLQGLFEPLV